VALAVLEHLPAAGSRFDAYPAPRGRRVVALAERLELLLSVLAKGDRPSALPPIPTPAAAETGWWQISLSGAAALDLIAVLRQATVQLQQLVAGAGDRAGGPLATGGWLNFCGCG